MPPEGPDDVNDDGLDDDVAPDASTLTARVEPVIIEDEMRSSYLDYAMSVIVGRALPDVRDGLKPVHRRILFSMFESNLRPDRPYRKCASAVGDVMKKYHPHGDSSIYDALVRMGQDFSIRYELIDGHGNFGSVDGDRAAAMRYTESRLSRLSMELLRDIDEDTVDFKENYDGYEQEPVVLPARFPNLLANGSTGIAVGMATNIPPHNLTELIQATIALIDDPSLTAVDLMQYVPAPDFPTGGLILGQAGCYDAYTTGRGSVKVRAVCEIEEINNNRERIVVTEIPFMVNKANLIIKIASLVGDKVIEGISDLRDESSREGMRVVVDIKRGHNGQVVLNQLFKHTQLQDSFGVNLLALVDGVPKTLTLDQCLRHYIDHQVEVITRRTAYRLRKSEERAHVLEGLLVALDHIDEIIALIRASESADAARGQLMTRFDLSDIQAQAILDMQLRRLAALERQRIQDEYDKLMEIITELRAILADPQRVLDIIKEEMTAVGDRYGDARRSKVVAYDGDMSVEDLIPEENVVITITRGGYVKRTSQSEFRAQRRGGVGVKGAAMKEDDIVSVLLTCSSHDYLLFFTNQGRVYRIKAYQVPEKARASRGVYLANVPGLTLEEDEKVAAVLDLREFKDDDSRSLLFATRKGIVKRTKLTEYDSPRSVLIAINLREDDELIGVDLVEDTDDVLIVSRNAQAIRFAVDDARTMGRSAGGVIGLRLSDDDEVLAMAPVADEAGSYLLVISEEGLGKRTPIAEYPTHKRGGKGVTSQKLTGKTGQLAGAVVVGVGDEILVIGSGGTVIRTSTDDVKPQGRNTQGVRIMNTRSGAQVIGVARVVEDDGEDDAVTPEIAPSDLVPDDTVTDTDTAEDAEAATDGPADEDASNSDPTES